MKTLTPVFSAQMMNRCTHPAHFIFKDGVEINPDRQYTGKNDLLSGTLNGAVRVG